MDLSCLDTGSRQFGSSVLAASAFYLMTGKSETLLKHITGYALVRIRMCVDWLEPFSTVINREGEPAILKEIKGVAPDDVHNIQINDACVHYDVPGSYRAPSTPTEACCKALSPRAIIVKLRFILQLYR